MVQTEAGGRKASGISRRLGLWLTGAETWKALAVEGGGLLGLEKKDRG